MPNNEWHFAVVVGIDEYPDIEGGSRNLRCPLGDAEAFGAWLREGGEVPSDQVAIITRTFPSSVGRTPPVPLRDEIHDAVYYTVRNFRHRIKSLPTEDSKRAAWEKSRFYFYISGHGLDAEGDDAVVVAANAKDDAFGYHVSTRRLLNKLKKNNVFAQIVVFADSCRELIYDTQIQDPPFEFKLNDVFDPPSGCLSFFACASRTRKQAFEPPAGSNLVHSFFTQALLDGLTSGIAGKEVNSNTLKDYLEYAVPELTFKHLNTKQHPEVAPADPGIVFARGSVIEKRKVRLRVARRSRFYRVPAIEAVIFSEGKVQKRVAFNLIGGRFLGELENGCYLILPAGRNPTDYGIPVRTLTVMGNDVDDKL